jgi:hypothetical protein
MRSRKFFTLAIFYVVIICVVAFAMFWFASTSKKLSPEYSFRMSSIFFITLMLAIYAICSGLAVSLIYTERQNLTFDILKSTPLNRYQIISGKILPAIVYILMLMFLSLPVTILIMPVSRKMGCCYLIVFLSATTFSIMGFAWSSIFRKIKTAISMNYAIAGFFTVGIILVHPILNKIFQVKLAPGIVGLLNALNPFWAILNVITGSIWSIKVSVLPAWSIFVLFYLILSMVAIIISIVKLKG